MFISPRLRNKIFCLVNIATKLETREDANGYVIK